MLRLNLTSQGNYSTNNYIVVVRLSRNRIEALPGSISAAIEFRQNSKASSTLSAEQYEVFLANLVDPDMASICYNRVMPILVVAIIVVAVILAVAFLVSFGKDLSKTFKKKKK